MIVRPIQLFHLALRLGADSLVSVSDKRPVYGTKFNFTVQPVFESICEGAKAASLGPAPEDTGKPNDLIAYNLMYYEICEP
jgi:hypothetical protein